VALEVEPAVSLRGDIAVPGDKSISHRALLLGAAADGESRFEGFGASVDTLATAAAMRALGAEVDLDGEALRVGGVGLRGLQAPGKPIDCGNAGTLMRLLPGLLVGQEGRFELVGDESLSRRPLGRIAAPLGLMGARVETDDGHAPLVVEGGLPLQAVRYELPVASAQVKSCVLLAGLYAEGGRTVVVEPHPSRDHTERMLEAAGVRVRRKAGEPAVWPAEALKPLSLAIPGDFSSAAPFVVAATLVPGSELHIHDVNLNPRRTGLLEILERMGARITTYNRRQIGGEPAGDLEVHSATLVGTRVTPDEKDEGRKRKDVSVFPLAFPFIAGPGALAIVLLTFGAARDDLRLSVGLFGAVVAVLVITYLLMRLTPVVMRVMGVTGGNVINRLSGVVLAALAVQFIITGATNAFGGG